MGIIEKSESEISNQIKIRFRIIRFSNHSTFKRVTGFSFEIE